MPRKRKRADNFSDLTPETFRRDDAGLDAEPVDPDFTLIADYWKQVLPPAEMEEVPRRLCTDDAFYEKVGPGLIAREAISCACRGWARVRRSSSLPRGG